MKKIRLKHNMDNEIRIVSLDEAFKEALGLSEGQSCKQEELETDLLNLLNKHEELSQHIKDSYKEHIITSWEYSFDYNVWLSKVKRLNFYTENYPAVVDITFIKNYIKNIHSNEVDFEEGNLLDRIDFYHDYKFILCEVKLDDIDYKGYSIDNDLIGDYLEEPINTMPPVLLESPLTENNEQLDLFPVIDGVHRCETLEKINSSKVLAYIPIKNNVF